MGDFLMGFWVVFIVPPWGLFTPKYVFTLEALEVTNAISGMTAIGGLLLLDRSYLGHWKCFVGRLKRIFVLLGQLHPGRLTWNIIIEVWKIIFLSKWVICMFHVNLPGCKSDDDNPKGWFVIKHKFTSLPH